MKKNSSRKNPIYPLFFVITPIECPVIVKKSYLPPNLCDYSDLMPCHRQRSMKKKNQVVFVIKMSRKKLNFVKSVEEEDQN